MIQDSLRRLSLHYTFKCVIACDHCITVSSPQRQEKIPFEMALTAVTKATEMGFYQLSFTGGEALIYKPEVLKLARIARDAGMNVLIMSNGFWARTTSKAEETAGELATGGVTHVCISTDKYHLRQGLPFEVVVNGARALRNQGIKVKAQYARAMDDPGLDEFLALSEPEKLVVDVFPVYPFGRAASFDRALMMMDPQAVDVRCSFGPMIMPDGQVIKCCGGRWVSERASGSNPAVLGDLTSESFEEIILRARGGEDVLLMGFCAWGPKKLGKILGRDFWTTEEKGPFNGICDLCTRLLNNPQRVDELRDLLGTPEMQRKVTRHAQLIDMFGDDHKSRWEKSFNSPDSTGEANLEMPSSYPGDCEASAENQDDADRRHGSAERISRSEEPSHTHLDRHEGSQQT